MMPRDQPFKVGDEVLRRDMFGEWQHGEITEVNNDDTFYVRAGLGRTYVEVADNLRRVVIRLSDYEA